MSSASSTLFPLQSVIPGAESESTSTSSTVQPPKTTEVSVRSENSMRTFGFPSAIALMSRSMRTQLLSIVSCPTGFCQTVVPLTRIVAWSQVASSTVSQRRNRSLAPTACEQSMAGERR